MNEKHAQFLGHVADYVTKNPEVAAYISDFVSRGITDALTKSNERASDMECAVLGLVGMPKKLGIKLALDKVLKWNGSGSLRWDATIEKLKVKVES